MSDGIVRIQLDVDDKYYYQMLSELLHEEIEDEYYFDEDEGDIDNWD